jgi:hypothetical protein
MNLAEALDKHADVELAPLGAEGRRRLSDAERSALRQDLDRIERANSRIVWVAVALLVVLFFAWLAIVLGKTVDAGKVQVASAAFGLSAAGCIRWLLKLWREKTSSALLLRLAVDLEGDALAAVINLLAAGQRRVRAAP